MWRTTMVSAGVLFWLCVPQSLMGSRTSLPVSIRTEIRVPAPSVLPGWTKLAGPYVQDVSVAAKETGLTPKLIAAVIYIESRDEDSAGTTGAIGPMQMTPTTAWQVLKVNPWKTNDNILGGAIYLKDLLELFHGHLDQALEADNAGPTAVMAGRVPIQLITYAHTVQQLMEHPQQAPQIVAA